MKGKRMKRQRAPSPLALTMACSSSEDRTSSISQGGRFVACDNVSSSGTGGRDSSVDRGVEGVGMEEEDMAYCLILLAGGERVRKPLSPAEPATVSTSASGNGGNKISGVDLYQCKTCNRCFPSFQALGGHRASHKKPRPTVNTYRNEKSLSLAVANPPVVGDTDGSLFMALSLQIPAGQGAPAQNGAGKSKVHECSICGAEFTSGQALGGHMRRHRTLVPAQPTAIGVGPSGNNISFQAQDTVKNSRNNLHLDLNLPAPEDRESKYSSLTTSKEQVLVFSASPLVDCYY
ncbi:hypothetical protein CDL15_Pgr002038 [Punica granatum]|nr:hypothetical protein CDL15_Pgr002038 [Punica granatum]